jgi:uncharacterized Ntn-hydrolase superfamily protein
VTYSIVARGVVPGGEGREPQPAWGVAVASKFLAVGSAVPAAAAGVGALATQAYANLDYRHQGLARLAAGLAAGDTLDALTAADDLRDERQVGAVDAAGTAASFTGSACLPWAGGVVGGPEVGGYAIQGNILTGPEVVEAMEEAWLLSPPHAPLGARLLVALQAGEHAGGDRRGRQSAAVLVVSAGSGYAGIGDVLVDLRVDDHADPVAELARLLELHHLYFGRPEETLPLEGDLAVEIGERLSRLGYATLEEWAGIANFEERMVDGAIDVLVLQQLRAATQ